MFALLLENNVHNGPDFRRTLHLSARPSLINIKFRMYCVSIDYRREGHPISRVAKQYDPTLSQQGGSLSRRHRCTVLHLFWHAPDTFGVWERISLIFSRDTL